MKSILFIIAFFISLNAQSQNCQEYYKQSIDSMKKELAKENIELREIHMKALLGWEKCAISNMELKSENAELEKDKARLISILRSIKGINQKEINVIYQKD